MTFMHHPVIAPAADAHSERRRALLRSHPEVRDLVGPARLTAIAILLLVGGQTGLAIVLAEGPWWLILLAAYIIGAVANLGCWALIHEGAHNLIVSSSAGNRWWSFVANLPILVPAAVHFRFWHRHHHNRIGQHGWDIDLPTAAELRLVRNCAVRTPCRWCGTEAARASRQAPPSKAVWRVMNKNQKSV